MKKYQPRNIFIGLSSTVLRRSQSGRPTPLELWKYYQMLSMMRMPIIFVDVYLIANNGRNASLIFSYTDGFRDSCTRNILFAASGGRLKRRDGRAGHACSTAMSSRQRSRTPTRNGRTIRKSPVPLRQCACIAAKRPRRSTECRKSSASLSTVLARASTL